MKRLIVLVVAGALLALAAAGSARAQGPDPASTRDPAQEQEIEKRLAAISADAVRFFQRATIDLDDGDAEKAKQGFEVVLQAAPKFPEALRRLAYAELQLGNVEAAIQRAREAVAVDNGAYNRVTLVRGLLAANDAADNAEALTLAKGAQAEQPGDLSTNEALMWAGAATGDTESIRKASAALAGLAPDYGWSHYFLGQLALQDGDRVKGQRELDLAKKHGVPEDMVNQALGGSSAAPTSAPPAPVQAPASAPAASPIVSADNGMNLLFAGALVLGALLVAAVLFVSFRRAA